MEAIMELESMRMELESMIPEQTKGHGKAIHTRVA